MTTSKRTPRSVRAWAMVDKSGRPMIVGCHVLKTHCPYAIYSQKDDLIESGGKMVEVLITPIQKKRVKRA